MGDQSSQMHREDLVLKGGANAVVKPLRLFCRRYMHLPLCRSTHRGRVLGGLYLVILQLLGLYWRAVGMSHLLMPWMTSDCPKSRRYNYNCRALIVLLVVEVSPA